MNLKTLFLLLGVVTLGFAANAQTQTTDTTHMARHRFQRAPNDYDGYAFHRPGHNHFGHNQFGRGRGHHEFIHYTPDQRNQAMAINKEDRQKREDLYKQDNITLKQYKAVLLALEIDKKAKLQALLTPQKMGEIAARHKKMDENHRVMAAAHLERLRLQLNLTDDQVAQIKTGQQNLHNQTEAIRDNDNLLPQQKREQIKALMTTRNDSFRTILTPDQFSKFQQHMKSRHHFGGPDGPGGPENGLWQGRGGRDS